MTDRTLQFWVTKCTGSAFEFLFILFRFLCLRFEALDLFYVLSLRLYRFWSALYVDDSAWEVACVNVDQMICWRVRLFNYALILNIFILRRLWKYTFTLIILMQIDAE